MNEYKPRIADRLITKKLSSKGAILVEGPKWCGKTTTSEQIAKSILYMDNPDEQEQNLQLSNIKPRLLLKGDTPRLIDEWQIAPKLWDAVRFEVDHRRIEGQFILTGSSVPPNYDDVKHTGTGRFAWILMYPMSLFESGESNGAVSLHDLFEGKKDIFGTTQLSLEDIAFLSCRGGWPRATFQNTEISLEHAFDYYDSIIKSDISSVDNILRNPERARNIMRSYARNQGTQVSIETIRRDIISNDNMQLNSDTVSSYLNALKKIFVIHDVTSWNPNLRSKTAIRSANTRYFIDPSIATAALGLGPNDLLNDLKTFGLIFETMCIRDLKVYASINNGIIYHYRDKNGLECDAVLHLRNGAYGLIEIKLGGDKLIQEAISTLKKLEEKIDTTKMKIPSFLMVLVANGTYAYQREDGIYIVPIGCLRD
ncbi:MAG: DUF4143 domain-containing protein [Erysipelotrichaceae bacterium]